MADIISGERVGSFLLLRDADGRRHAIRPSCLLAMSESSEEGDITFVQLPGGRTMSIRTGLEEVLGWVA